MTITEETEYLELLEQEDRERVSPKFEQIRHIALPIIVARGGRGAGAKSWSIASLLVQELQYETHRCACLREIQKTLSESVYQLIVDTIDRLRYTNDWHITEERIEQKYTGSFFIFKGLKDLRATRNVKGLEGIDRAWVDEAATVSDDSWMMLEPTLARNKGWKLYISYNPETDYDPCSVRFWDAKRDDVQRIQLYPGVVDNPWWNEGGLQKLMDQLYVNNPDEAEHVYGGQPRKQGDKCVMSRVSIRGAMNRKIKNPIGVDEVGVDVARFGDDRTEMYRRHGLKVIDHKESNGTSNETTALARTIWEFAGKDPRVLIKVDAGYNPGVIDCLRNTHKAKVVAVDFGGSPMDKDKYVNCATEMWFEFPIDDVDIPDDPELAQELGGRLYEYEPGTNRKKIESKDKYKERFKRSPDKADGLLLCFYQGGKILVDDETRKQMAARRARGR